MTTLLIDTNVFLGMRWVANSVKVHLDIRAELEAAEKLTMSIASLYEVNQKVRVGKLDTEPLNDASIRRLQDRGIDLLPLSPLVMAHAASLFWRHRGHEHRDPFDRMIAATALADNMTIVSSDAAFDALDIDRIWT